jgi:hypothetical protein
MRYIVGLCCVIGLALSAGAAVGAEGPAELKAVIDKAIQVAGGEEKLTRLKAATWKGKGKFYGLGEGIDFGGEWSAQLPLQTRVVMEIDVAGQKITIVRVLNGDQGWSKMMDATEEMDKETLAQAREELYGNWVASLVPLKDAAFRLSGLGDVKVGDRPAIGIKVSHPKHRDVNLYFDKDKGLLAKVETRVKDMQSGQEVTQENFLGDYKDVQGVQRPHKITLKREGKDYVDMEINEIKLLEKLDDSIFSKP